MEKDERKVLQELLKLLSDHPEIADRITITIKPREPKQDNGQDK